MKFSCSYIYWIISYIFNKTNIPREMIKSIIWNAESGPNNRKSWTIDRMHIAKAEDIWPIISEYLEKARDIIISKHYASASSESCSQSVASEM